MKDINSTEELNYEKFEFEKKKLKKDKLKLAIGTFTLFGMIFIQIALVSFLFYKGYSYLNSTKDKSKDHIAVINIDQVITEEYSDKISNKISQIKDELEKNKNIKGLVVRLRSPGGSPSASWTISTELKELEDYLPVFTYIDSAAVSGSYMIASQSEKIYSNKFAMVGSIGVILEHLIFKDLSEKVGVGQETLTAGKYKKMISSFKYLNEEDKKYLEDNVLNEIYNSFLSVVSEGRHISIENLKELAEGRVFVATDKKVMGTLIDEIITWTNMKKLIIKDLDIASNTKFVIYNLDEKSKLAELLSSSFKLDLGLNNSSLTFK